MKRFFVKHFLTTSVIVAMFFSVALVSSCNDDDTDDDDKGITIADLAGNWRGVVNDKETLLFVIFESPAQSGKFVKQWDYYIFEGKFADFVEFGKSGENDMAIFKWRHDESENTLTLTAKDRGIFKHPASDTEISVTKR